MEEKISDTCCKKSDARLARLAVAMAKRAGEAGVIFPSQGKPQPSFVSLSSPTSLYSLKSPTSSFSLSSPGNTY